MDILKESALIRIIFHPKRPVSEPGQFLTAGSGTVISKEGRVLTAAHVIKPPPNFPFKEVILGGYVLVDEKVFSFELEPIKNSSGSIIDHNRDFVVLQIKDYRHNTLPFVEVSDEHNIKMGEEVLVSGYRDLPIGPARYPIGYTAFIASTKYSHARDQNAPSVRMLLLTMPGIQEFSGASIIRKSDGKIIGVFSMSLDDGKNRVPTNLSAGYSICKSDF